MLVEGMAVPGVFDSSAPFVVAGGGPLFSKDDFSRGCDEQTDPLVRLSRAMQHGTAKHVVVEAGEDQPCLSIVAQAEREDFQEFSPSGTQCPYSRSQLFRKYRFLSRESALRSDSEDEDVALYRLQRKQRRKWKPWHAGGQEEPPVIQGVWVREVDWLKSAESSSPIIPPPPQFTDSVAQPCGPAGLPLEAGCGWTDVFACETGQLADTDDCDLDQDSESESDSSCGAEKDPAATTDLTYDLMQVSSASDVRWSDSAEGLGSLLGGSDAASTDTSHGPCVLGRGDLNLPDSVVDVLRGRVMQMTKTPASALFKNLLKQTLSGWRSSQRLHEGLLFQHQLQPSGGQYREGEEYCILHHVQNGSYGDVFCVQDTATGFTCAAKRIPLRRFSPEEVCTWSVLTSPRVVELFGAVREGPAVVLFMDLKPACLAQLLKDKSSLPEDLALHYLHQTLGALEHLHNRKVLHLDVKVENVLLSADCRDTFLCDFGLSETVDENGWSNQAFRGGVFPGTETHMAPEVARGDPLSAKADVWSSCCMLLHMLNGCRPWTRYYSHPLCLQIVNEPPPLWEVPSNCNNFTAKVFRAGLRKDPERRASAKALRRKSTKALRAVGGLSLRSVRTACDKLYLVEMEDSSSCPSSAGNGRADVSAPAVFWVSPWRTAAVDEDGSDGNDIEAGSRESEPRSLQDEDWACRTDSEVDLYTGEDDYSPEKSLKTDRDYEGDWEEEGDEEDEEWSSTEYLQALTGFFPLLQKCQAAVSCGSEKELEYLRKDVTLGATISTPSPEPRDEPPSCFSSSETSQSDATEDSEHSSDDLSSGVFSSCHSCTGPRGDCLVSANQPSLYSSSGVDIWIENVQGECLRIRERREIRVGHVAIGISDKVSGKPFTLETLDRKTVPFDEEIREPCVWLRCVPALDRCQHWSWRVREGKLELRE